MQALRSCLLLPLFALLFALPAAKAQNVTKLEYFVDVDPGHGKGTSVTVTPGTDVTASFTVPISSFSPGFHSLYIRGFIPPYSVTENGKTEVKGGWSLTQVRNFYKENFSSQTNTLSAVVAGEYFADNDPGFGKGTPIPLTSGMDLNNVSFTFDITALEKGFHNLYVRFRDARGAWSHTSVRTFYKEAVSSSGSIALADVNKGEYFIDADPGFGKGTNISLTPGKDLSNVSFTVNLSSLTTGFHQLYTRFRDANGVWSLAAVRTFYKESISTSTSNPLANVSAGEYFFDQDPGFGKGINVAVTPGLDLNNVSITADVSSLSKGFHQLYIRFRDANGVWSQTNTRSFYKETVSSATSKLAKITKLEYFVDTDPGFGKGTSVAVAPSLSIDSLSFFINMDNVTVGNHKVYVRAQDENGVWSLVSSGDFKVETSTDLIIKIGNISTTLCAGANVAIPYTVNGLFGSNNVFTAQLSNANGSFANPVVIGTLTRRDADTIKAVIPANTAAGGNYRIRIVASSPLDTSGATQSITINRVPEAGYSITGNNAVCIGNTSYTLSSSDPAATLYTWSLQNGGTLDTAKGTTVRVNWSAAGTHVLKVVASNACGNGVERTLSVRVYAGPPTVAPVLTASGNLLTASNIPSAEMANGYRWYRDTAVVANATGSTLTVSQDGSYSVRFVNPCGEGPRSNLINFVGEKQNQSITFQQETDKTYGQVPYVVLKATASSGLPVTFSLLQGSGNIKEDTLFIAGAGLFKVRATQPGNTTTYNAATADMSFEVKKAAASIVFTNLTQVFNGATKQPTVTTTPTGLGVNLTYNGIATPPTNAGEYKVVAVISNANYEGKDSANFVIQKASQSITLSAIPDLSLTTQAYKVSAVASSGLPVTLALAATPAGSATLSNDTIYTKGMGSAILTASQPGNSNFDPAAIVRDTFEIRKATQVISFPAINNKVANDPPFVISATASSGLPVSFKIVSGPATLKKDTVTLTGTGTVTVEANQSGNTIYDAAAPVQQRFNVTSVIKYPDLTVQNVISSKTLLGPGESVMISWKVVNIGAGQSPAKWTENIYVQSPDGQNRTAVQLVSYSGNSPLDSGQSVSRSATITLPSNLNIGDEGVFVVELVPDPSVHEIAGGAVNNTGVQQSAWSIKKLLTLTLSASQITEGAQGGITATVSRTGSLAAALTVQVGVKHAQRFALPGSVVIPAGQAGVSFTITAPDNNIVEGRIADTVKVSATGFTAASAPLAHLDNDQASLTITDLGTQAKEGDTVRFKVNTNLAPAAPLTIYLTSSNQARFGVPSSVVIPAGSLSATISVNIVQNNIPEVDQTISIKAGAADHHATTAAIVIKDDDLPNLELVLQTNLVSEGAGLYATQATLRRIAASNPVALTANLSASLSNTLILPASISLAAGENEKTFNIGVVDNTLADGERKVTITASLYIASCGCSAPPATSGSVAAVLTVTDNDGPALILTTSALTLPEGRQAAAQLRITRNTPTAAALEVSLSSSDTTEARISKTAVIPAGKEFVEVPINTFNDGVEDGNKQVYFEAKATGFATGSVWVIVTDQNKPDWIVSTGSGGDTAVQAQELFNYRVNVKNIGFATAPEGVKVRGYLSRDNVLDDKDTLILEDILTAPIPAGQTVPLLNAVKAPNLPGRYNLLFKVNPDASMTELSGINNVSDALRFTIRPSYTAQASVVATQFTKATPVPITGTATRKDGSPATNEPVEVYVITNGLRRTLTVKTDASGKFATQFVPIASEAGHYTVGASFPGIEATEAQDEFDILGVLINGGDIPKFKVILNDTLKGTLQVKNLSNATLKNFSLSPVNLPGGAKIEFAKVASFAGNATIQLAFSVVGGALSPGSNFEVASFDVMGNEVQVQTANVFYFCQAPQAYVVADVTKINASVSKSRGERLVEFRLVNKGLGATGNISILLPQAGWIMGITPTSLPSLNQGDSAIVVLKYLATDDVPFDYPVNGNIGVRTQNGNSFQIPFVFQKVAESKGAVKITVTNQFTYYTEGAPNVKDAFVCIKNYFSGEVYAKGYTDANGVFAAGDIPEGKHRVVVEKEKHLPYSGLITIEPGDTTKSTLFINYQAITFSWEVVPTAVQDKYEITLVTKFETHVPIPVVTIDMPKKMPSLTGSNVYAFNVTLTNHGLVTAKDVALNLPNSDPEYEFVTNYTPADLLAQQSIQVPVIMRRREGGSGGRVGLDVSAVSRFLGMDEAQYASAAKMANGSGNCQDFVGVVYWYKCNLSSGLWEKGGVLFTYDGRECSGGGGGGNNPILIGQGGGGGNGFPQCAICPDPDIFQGDKNWTNPIKQEKKSCVQCLNELAQAILGCLGVDIPPPIKCLADTYADKGGPKKYAECLISETASAMVGSATEKITDKIPYYKQLKCLKDILSALATCLASVSEGEGNRTMMSRVQGSGTNSVLKEINSNLQVINNAYGVKVRWLNEYFGELSDNGSWNSFSTLISPYVIEKIAIPDSAQQEILQQMNGFEMPVAGMKAFFHRWNLSIEARDKDILKPNAQYPDIINWTVIKGLSDSLVDAHNYAVAKGYSTIDDMDKQSRAAMDTIINAQKEAVCASVTVQFSQTLTMTREAFRGTLEIFNGHPTDRMDSLTVNLLITDPNGVPSNALFQINTESLTNLSDVAGTGIISAQERGKVQFLFIPTLNAAPTVPVVYNFGGTIRYWDPYAKAMVTMPLSPVPLTVNPSPNLMLHYFMQRNILGDDPLTSPDIEPSIPAELSVMVENQGYGPAVNMSISSAQPKIIENEKGLAINFKLIGSNFQGKPTNFGVTDINFGTIPPLQTRVGQWYFTSSLLGKFVSYEASVVHSNSFGNPELSLVKGVKLHELTKSIKVYGADNDGINDFLVNDIFDVHDRPDIIYFSQGNRTEKVFAATEGKFSSAVAPPSFTNTLTITASDTGWNYIKLPDPGNGRYELVSVTRSDGQVIPLDNAWLTFVTLPVSRPPVYENKFHFVDLFPSKTPVTYTVVWKPKNLNVPAIVKITGPTEPVTGIQVKTLTVVFDKAIDAATFGPEDLTLTFQGGANIIDNTVKITPVDSVTFTVDLSMLTTGNGFYAFTAQAAGVKDVFGISGKVGKQFTWSQFLTIPTVQAFIGLPDGNIASSFDTLQVLFNIPINESTVTPQRFIITKEGVTQSGTVTIDSVRADKKLFYLSGLGNILKQSGEYQFTVDLPKIKSTTNEFGTEPQSVRLVLDKDGPVLLTMAKLDSGGIDPQHMPFVRLVFNEDVKDFNIASLKLTRNGEVLPLAITQLSNTDYKNWLAGGFGMLTYPDGEYTFTVDLSSLKDAIGNSGSGTQTISWKVNRSALITVSNLRITPDLGHSDEDDITSGQSFNATFNLSSNASQVTLSQVDLSGETVLTVVPNLPAGTSSLPVTFVKGGNTGLKVTATGSNGGVATATRSLFVDESALTGKWLFASNQQLKKQVDTVPVLFSSKLLSSKELVNAIQLKRNETVISTDGLSFRQINDTLYHLVGIRQKIELPGSYQLTLGLQWLKKHSSGLPGNGAVSVSWTVLSVNQAPVARAGRDTLVTQTGTVRLNGSASSDPDGDKLTYRWVAPQGIVLKDSTSATPSFEVTTSMHGSAYPFLLIVSDGELFATAKVNVTVRLCGPEVCNGLDDDCDGLIDEDFTVVYYRDSDGDGFGNKNESVVATTCKVPIGYVTTAGDCDDNNKGVWRTGTFFSDKDGDEFTTGDGIAVCYGTSTPQGFRASRSAVDDCNDADETIYPGAPELCDGKDNDCNGKIDDNATMQTYYRDSDGDGFGDPNNTTMVCSPTPPAGYVADRTDCDDTKVLYEDKDKDGYGSETKLACGGVENNLDCNDADASIHALQTYYADSDGDGFGDPDNTKVECSSTPPAGYVRNNLDCDDTKTMYADKDGDGYGSTEKVPCKGVSNHTDCNDNDAAVYPGAPEIKDKKDNNCNGQIDEDVSGELTVWYRDADKDGYGNPDISITAVTQPEGYVKNNTDCDDTRANVYPGAPEVLDGLDNDCDGIVDDVITLSVSTFTLVNASTNKDVGELKDGDVVDLAVLQNAKLNIRANTTPGVVGSVVFDLQGPQVRQQTENVLPYALFGDNMRGRYYGVSLPPGDYTLTATAYSGAKGKGTKGTTYSVRFKVVYAATVADFTLVNADTDNDIGQLKNGDVIDLATLAGARLNIRANTNPAQVGSVVFELNGPQTHMHTDNGAPYALLDNNGSNYHGATAQPGVYTLTATPYSESRGGGVKGVPATIQFTVIYSGYVSTFTLVNASANKDVGELKDGDVVDLAVLQNAKLNIRANTTPGVVGSVVFDLQGPQVRQQTENVLPYALFGDNMRGRYYGVSLPPGDYTLTATAYSEAKGKGVKGTTYSIRFTVVDGLSSITSTNDSKGGQPLLKVESKKSQVSLSASPNPFSSEATVRFSVTKSGFVTLVVHDLRGTEVARLYQGQVQGGKEYRTIFTGSQLPAGVYLLRLSTENAVETFKVVLVR